MSHRVSDKRVPCKSVRPTRVSQSVQQECQTLFGRLFSGACVPILFLTVHYLQILSALCCGVAMDVNLAAHFKHGRQQLEGLPSVAKLSDQVMVILGLNPGPYTLQGTNCYLIGRGRKRVLVDTGEGRAEFVESLVQVLHGEDCEITDVILTHTHVDHIGGLPDLVQRFPDLQVWRCQPASGLSFGQLGTAEDATDPAQTLGKCRQTRFRPLKNGEVLKLHGSTLKAIHTPGHANDHVCFWLEEEKALFTGDHILGTGTVIVQDLEAYMSSLELLHSFRPERIYPGHGPMLQGDAARNRPRDYIQHRHLRLKKARPRHVWQVSVSIHQEPTRHYNRSGEPVQGTIFHLDVEPECGVESKCIEKI